MAIPHAQPGEIVDVTPLGPALATTTTKTLFKTECLEVIRIVMQAGKIISEHEAPGEIIVQCLEGRIEFTAAGETQELGSGQLLYLEAATPHSICCAEDASFLVTIVTNR
jgi:quercetin dioxygenase-like cupin family protein